LRKLVTVKTIDRIDPIENADAIESAVIGGWHTVVRKGEFTAGDSVIYFEVDAFLPAGVPAFASFSERSSKTVDSPVTNLPAVGHVLRTMRLRGTLSQGLALPLQFGLTTSSSQEEVETVMAELGVFKYETPVPSTLSGEIAGSFPSGVQKTDSERVQNLTDEFLAGLNAEDWYATEKIDGTSATFVNDADGLRFASRNWELKDNGTHVFSRIAAEFNLREILPVGAVMQGEIYGPGIQGNPLRVKNIQFAMFTLKLPEGVTASPELEKFTATHSVPVLDWTLPATVDEAVETVYDMRSHFNANVQAEGVVWWNSKGEVFPELGYRANFKAINNKFLLKR
jgi:RNA ligase (TIGR02306 family)